MELTMHGTVDGPAIAAIGTWDPPSPSLQRMLTDLTARGVETGLRPVAVLLDPPPQLYVNGEARWPVYQALADRLKWLQDAGAAVAQVHFAREDVDAPAVQLFDLLGAHLGLGELWIKHHQTLGSGAGGSGLAIRVHTIKRKIVLRHMEQDAGGEQAYRVRTLLNGGAVRAAAAVVGFAPSRARAPGEEVARMGGWKPGAYEVTVEAPGEAATRSTIQLTAGDDGTAWFGWDDVPGQAVTFLRGPGDVAARAPAAPACAAVG